MLTMTRHLPRPVRRMFLETADVPRDLASVTTIASAEEADFPTVGLEEIGDIGVTTRDW